MKPSIGSVAVGPHPQSVSVGRNYSMGFLVRLGIEPLELSWHLSFYSRSQRRSPERIYLLQHISDHFLFCVAFVPRRVGATICV
jgi:hypothetical protein